MHFRNLLRAINEHAALGKEGGDDGRLATSTDARSADSEASEEEAVDPARVNPLWPFVNAHGHKMISTKLSIRTVDGHWIVAIHAHRYGVPYWLVAQNGKGGCRYP